ncbi:MAG TPA: alpha/beta hydrolase [Telluria sp.]|nr:alpha/beta hydrolase [Telluria sp.]
MPIAKANGIEIAYETAGDPRGPPVLLIMGLGMQLNAWPDDFVDGLSELGFYVIRFDNRDCGLSTKFDKAGTPNLFFTWLKSRIGWRMGAPYLLGDMADDALGLLDWLRIPQAHVVGVSMGGMIAQVMASRYPERVLSLTSMMSTTGRRSLPGPARAVREVLARAPRRPANRRALIDHMVQVLAAIGSPAYPTPEAVLRRRVLAAVERNVCPGGVLRQLVAIAASGERCAELQALRVRTLVIHGAADPLVPVECGIDTASQVDGAQLEVIEGMGHDIPAALVERLVALIDAHAHGKMAFDPIVRLFEKQ